HDVALASAREPDSSCPRPPVAPPSVRITPSVKAPLRLIPPLRLRTHARVRTILNLRRCLPSPPAGFPLKAVHRPRRLKSLADPSGGSLRSLANPNIAAGADSHPYAYSASPDKATKATPADKIGPARGDWTSLSRRAPNRSIAWDATGGSAKGALGMKEHYRVVVIGGGVVGASVLYHLAKLGWTDVALIERSVLTAGSSWHAAGGFHALNANPNMAILQAYTIDLLRQVEAESGQSIGMHMTGAFTWLRRRSAGNGCRRPIAASRRSASTTSA